MLFKCWTYWHNGEHIYDIKSSIFWPYHEFYNDSVYHVYIKMLTGCDVKYSFIYAWVSFTALFKSMFKSSFTASCFLE